MENASGVARELPKYQCHKKVWALKIKTLLSTADGNNESDGSLWLYPADEGYARLRLDHEYVHKHKPQEGGYYVVYDDGYKSYSPAKAFEGGYTKL